MQTLLVMKSLAERWRLKNFTPFPIVLLRVGQWKDEVIGSKNNSSTKLRLALYIPRLSLIPSYEMTIKSVIVSAFM